MPFFDHRRGVRLADRMSRAGGKSSGFDYLRLLLALSVVGWHSVLTSYGPNFQAQVLAGPWRLVINIILPMFFALSGFLVAGSLQRNTISTFLGLRVLRIVPALAVEVCLSALLLGPLLTALPLAEYFSDSRFLTYPLNIVGDIHYFLPGVFDHNPDPFYVNAQLWTIPFELECYIALGLMAVVGLCRRAELLVCAVVTLNIIWAGMAYMKGMDSNIVAGPVLPLCFLAGVTLYVTRDRVPAGPILCMIALGLTIFGLAVPFGDFFIPFPAAYLTVTIGLLSPRKCWLVQWGDFSYGIYLYGFPIEQLVAAQGAAFHHWYMVLGFSAPLIIGMAAFSWNFVEKPILNLHRHVRKLDVISCYVRQRRRRLAAAMFGASNGSSP